MVMAIRPEEIQTSRRFSPYFYLLLFSGRNPLHERVSADVSDSKDIQFYCMIPIIFCCFSAERDWCSVPLTMRRDKIGAFIDSLDK
jgi:hypothetical protein